MSAATPMAFGGLSNGFAHTPRHIRVHDEGTPKKPEMPLSGYLTDPRYLTDEVALSGHESVSDGATTLAGGQVPPLTPLEAAEHYAEEDIEETEHRIFWHDWRHIIIPVAIILFIMALGLANIIFSGN